MQQFIGSQVISHQGKDVRRPLVVLVSHNPAGSMLNMAITSAGIEVINLRPADINDALADLQRCVTVVLDASYPPREWMLLCSRLISQPALNGLTVVVASTSYTRRDVRAWIEAGAADYIDTLCGYENLLARLHVLSASRARTLDEERQLLTNIDTTILRTMAAHDPATAQHMYRVARLSVALGHQLGLGPVEIGGLARGALFHDMGKLAICPTLLRKAGPLNDVERAMLRQHPATGASIIAGLPGASAFLPIVRSHHERLNGCGYPDGLRGTAIPLGARIVAVADAFDAMTTPRPYCQLLAPAAALGHLGAEAGTAWDERVVIALTQTLDLPSEVPPRERVVGEALAA